MSPFEKPTRAEALNYYRKVVDKFDLQLAYEEAVVSIAREDAEEPGERRSRSSRSRRDRHAECAASAMRATSVLAIGYFDRPVMLGIPGEDLPHVHHYYSEPHPHYRQRVVVVGGGNSAAESSLEMYRAGAHVTLIHRHPELKSTIKYWVRPDIDNRIREESIAARFNTCITEIRPTSVVVKGTVVSRRFLPMPCSC